MITDVSGVAYEFLVTGKPVVFFDCPEFYQHTVSPANPTLTLSEIIERDTINGGRRYGTVVRSLPELTQALSQPLPAPNADQMQNGLLYNPGCATAVMLKTLTDIFARQY
jgi:CDP-glycerol glycerophosphotransferase (TagB/SpsB family)